MITVFPNRYLVAGLMLALGVSIASLSADGAAPPDDYVYSAKPSPAAKHYFYCHPRSSYGVELKRGMADHETGVCYMKNGDIVIPAGRCVTFSGSGCCMDPTLPAPGMGGCQAQFVQSSKLIHPRLKKAYARLLDMDAKGYRGIDQLDFQHLIWAIRSVGQENSYADSLSEGQYRILDECMSAKGAFKKLHQRLLEKNKKDNAAKTAAPVASSPGGTSVDTDGRVEVGGLSYNISDLSDETKGRDLIGRHVEELVQAGMKSNVECPEDFRYGRLDKGFYSDVQVSGFSYNARILNVSNDVKLFRMSDYSIQVGNGFGGSKCQRIAAPPPVIIIVIKGGSPKGPNSGGKEVEGGVVDSPPPECPVVTNSIPEVANVTNVVNITITNVVEQIITNIVEQINTNIVEQIDTNVVQVTVTNIVQQIETNRVGTVEEAQPVFRIVELTYDVSSGRGKATVKIQSCTAKKAKKLLSDDFSKYLFDANIYDASKFDTLWRIVESIPRNAELRIENIHNRGNTIYVEFAVSGL